MQRILTPRIDAYAAAAILIYTHLWADLEEVCLRLMAPTDGSAAPIEHRMTIIRLEVLILLDACDSARWRSMLGGHERAALNATLKSVLETLDVPTMLVNPEILGATQNQLFDAVMSLSGADATPPTKSLVPSHLLVETLAYA